MYNIERAIIELYNYGIFETISVLLLFFSHVYSMKTLNIFIIRVNSNYNYNINFFNNKLFMRFNYNF